MNELISSANLKDKLETYLDKACQAEAQGNHVEAERCFRLALYCEGRLRPDVSSAKEYAYAVKSL